MCKIETEAYTPKNIGAVKFRIPLYQRPYAWETKQIQQLLEDLFKASQSNEYYYIGILSIGKTEADENLFDLIDGQQRITTLTLIGRILLYYHKDWKSFLENRLDLYGRVEDKLYLDTLKEDSNPNPKMIDAIKTVNTFLNDKTDSEKTVFSEYVYKKAAFFLSEIPSDYTIIDKNLQFVRMNNRGKQLEAHDILKMKLASKINDQNKRTQFVKEWNEISQMGCKTNEDSKTEELVSKSLIEIFNDESVPKTEPKENEIFYQSIVTFPEFLLIALARFDSENFKISYQKDKLLEVFGFGIGKIWEEKASPIKFMEFLGEQFELFKKYFIKRDREEKYKLPFDKDKPEQLSFKIDTTASNLEQLKMFQSYLYVSTDPHNWLIGAFEFLKDKHQVDVTEFLNVLKTIDNIKTIDNSRKKSTHNLSLRYGDIDRYWFWRLDYYLWENRMDNFSQKTTLDVASNYNFRSNRSIEHISPQTPEENSAIKLEKDEILDWFGNLAMISSNQNSSLQNRSFEVKRAHVDSFINKSKNGSIESLKLLKVFDYEIWNEENVKKHGNEMIDILIESFTADEYYKDIRDLLRMNKI